MGPYALLMFGGVVSVDHEHQRITIDGWIRLDAAARIGGVYIVQHCATLSEIFVCF